MPARVLLVSHDLDFLQLIKDVVSISYRNPVVEKLLDIEKLRERLSRTPADYQLIIADAHFEAPDGRAIGDWLAATFPDVLPCVVLVEDAQQGMVSTRGALNVPVITKPFSLDVFDQIVKKIHTA